MLAKYPGQTFYPTLEWTVSGLAGTIGVRINKKSDGSTVVARTTVGVTEFGTSGEYTGVLAAPLAAGDYSVRWDDGSTALGHVASEDLVVTYDAPTVALPGPLDLTTVAMVKFYVETGENTSDALIQTYITAASAEIERRYQRMLCDHGTSTRTFEVFGQDKGLVDLAPCDLRAPTAITLQDPEAQNTLTLTSLTDYILRPAGGWDGLGTYTRLKMNKNVVTAGYMINYDMADLIISGSWGPATIPPDVADAAAVTVASWFDKAFASYGQSFVDDTGRAVRPDTFGGWRIPMSAHGTLGSYDRRPGSSVI